MNGTLTRIHTQIAVRVFRFEGGALAEKMSFSGGNGRGCLTSFSFSRSVRGEGSFSLRLKESAGNPAERDSEASSFDAFRTMDVVRIYEKDYPEGEKPCFSGVVHGKQVSASVGGDGKVRKETVVTGSGVFSLFGLFRINLDSNAAASADVNLSSWNERFKTDFFETEGDKIRAVTVDRIAQSLWQDFREIASGKAAGLSNVLAGNIIDAVYPHDNQYAFCRNEAYYPISTDIWSETEIDYLSQLRKLLPSATYEIFGQCTDGTETFVIREKPFDPEVWSALKCRDADMSAVTDYDFSLSDDEVYSVFFSYVHGSPLDPEWYRKSSADAGGQYPGIYLDQEKIGKYGYRVLVQSFSGYHDAGGKDSSAGEDLLAKAESLNRRLACWYSHLDEFYSGRLKMAHVFPSQSGLPACGEKIRLMGAEFYVTEEKHSWTYGRPVSVEYTLERGGVYNGSGEFAGSPEGFSRSLAELAGGGIT